MTAYAELPSRWRGDQSGDVEVLAPVNPWSPRVLRRDETLLMVVLVPDRHFETVYEFPVEPRHLHVLRTDRERYFFLFAVLSQMYSDVERYGWDGELVGRVRFNEVTGRFEGITRAELTSVLETVLFGEPADVEPLLDEHDRWSAGAVSHVVAMHTGVDHAVLREGRWFGVGVGGDAGD